VHIEHPDLDAEAAVHLDIHAPQFDAALRKVWSEA